MSLKKRYLKSKPICKVTFTLPKQNANTAARVFLVGDFNNWNTRATPMKALKSGAFTVTLDLPKEKKYQFRYLLDNECWENDGEADSYVPNGFGDADNSVVVL